MSIIPTGAICCCWLIPTGAICCCWLFIAVIIGVITFSTGGLPTLSPSPSSMLSKLLWKATLSFSRTSRYRCRVSAG